MQMSNGWSFTFAGNVNAFYIYTDGNDDDDAPGVGVAGGVVVEEQNSSVRTGLLPAFAVFEAKGHEKGVDLGVHFGFAPQIQNGGFHDNFGRGTQAGAQIDMRQVFAFVSGPTWGQILFGREIGLFDRQNILTDMSLFGVGTTGGGGDDFGTTLGRIGVGYIYPNFVAQLTYSTPAGKPFQLSVGAFDPNFVNSEADLDSDGDADAFTVTKTPRFEGEVTYNGQFGGGNSSVLLWANGTVQNAEAPSDTDTADEVENDDVTAVAGGAGVRLNFSGVSIVGSGYIGSGVGTTLLQTTPFGVDPTGDERRSFGYIGQLTYTTPGGVTFGGSYGDSRIDQSDFDEATDNDGLLKSNRSVIGTIVWQATQSLKVVGEYTHTESESHGNVTLTSDQGAVGFMLFY
jgi:predicted porin